MSFKNWLNESKKYNYDDVLRLAKVADVSTEEINKYSKDQLVAGLNVESEHKQKDIDVIGKKEENILKIAIAHLREDDKYYEKLKKVEGK